MWANAKRGHMISLTTQICVGKHARLPSSWAIGNLDRLPISHLATQSGTICTARCEGLKHLMRDQESFYDHVRAGESKLNDLLKDNEMDGPVFKMKVDPRPAFPATGKSRRTATS